MTQPYLPDDGFAPTPAQLEIGEAARAYIEARDARMEATREEVDRRTALLDSIHAHNVRTYAHDGLKVEIVAQEKVKVSRSTDADEETEAELIGLYGETK